MTSRSSRISSGKLHQKMLASLLVSAILVAKNRATYQYFKCCKRFPPRHQPFAAWRFRLASQPSLAQQVETDPPKPRWRRPHLHL